MLIVEEVAFTELILEFVKVTLLIFELLISHQVDIVEFMIEVLPVVEAVDAWASVGEK